MRGEDISLKTLNSLINAGGYLDTKQLMKICECDRKSVYRAIDRLEVNGFSIEIKKGFKGLNLYRFIGVCGL